MNELYFSPAALWGIAICGRGMILLPILVCILWQKKTHAKLLPVITGAVTFFVFAILLKLLPAYLLYYSGSAVSETIQTTPWLYYLVGGLLAGIFEETGRFIAYRTVLRNHTAPQTCLAYGIGHGGFESLYIGGQICSMFVMAMLINHGMLGEILKDMSEEQRATAIEQLSGFAQYTVGTGFLDIWERISAMLLQISLSVMVFRAVHDRKLRWLYPAAMLLHTAVDFSIITAQAHPMLSEVLLFAAGAAMFYLTLRFLYRQPAGEGTV